VRTLEAAEPAEPARAQQGDVSSHQLQESGVSRLEDHDPLERLREMQVALIVAAYLVAGTFLGWQIGRALSRARERQSRARR
jgi:aryl-alcohol dehydrogenase-like predicted oxidoreductase